MKKLIISALCMLLTHSTHTVQAMIDADIAQAAQGGGPAAGPQQPGLLNPRVVGASKMRRRSINRRNRPAPLAPIANFFEEEANKKRAAHEQKVLKRKLASIEWLINDIIEWEGPMLERDETLHNITTYINQPLFANEHALKMAYLETMEDRLTEKLLAAKQAIKEKYDLREDLPAAGFAPEPVAGIKVFSLNPEEMAAMHESDTWRSRLPLEKRVPEPILLEEEPE